MLGRSMIIVKNIQESFYGEKPLDWKQTEELFKAQEDGLVEIYPSDIFDKLSSDGFNLEKAGKDVSKLQKKVITNSKGQRQTVYVKNGEDPKKDKKPKKEEQESNDSKSEKKISNQHPKDIAVDMISYIFESQGKDNSKSAAEGYKKLIDAGISEEQIDKQVASLTWEHWMVKNDKDAQEDFKETWEDFKSSLSNDDDKGDNPDQELYDTVRGSVGDQYTDDQIDSVFDAILEQLAPHEIKATRSSNREKHGENMWSKAREIAEEIRDGDHSSDLDKHDIEDICYGIVDAYTNHNVSYHSKH